MTLYAFLTHWFLSDYKFNIPAYRLLHSHDVKNINRGRQILYEMREMVLFIEERGREHDVWNEKEEWDLSCVSKLFDGVYYTLEIKSDRHRKEQISWKTVYNLLVSRHSLLEINK